MPTRAHLHALEAAKQPNEGGRGFDDHLRLVRQYRQGAGELDYAIDAPLCENAAAAVR